MPRVASLLYDQYSAFNEMVRVRLDNPLDDHLFEVSETYAKGPDCETTYRRRITFANRAHLATPVGGRSESAPSAGSSAPLA